MGDTGGAVTVAELVDYCQTQARLLHGYADTLEEETASLLSDIDEELAAMRAQLDEYEATTTESSSSPPSPDTAGTEGYLADLEAIEDNLAEQQAVVEAKQTRQAAFEELATDYVELAETLAAKSPPVTTALTRVLEFERDRDAHTYFDDRLTMLEAAAKSDKD